MSQVKTASGQSEIKRLEEQLKALKAQIPSVQNKEMKITSKIGEKGTVNFYGLRKFPICLFASEVAKLTKLFNSPEFQEFVKSNAESLARKEVKAE